jgi:hypothetical protein
MEIFYKDFTLTYDREKRWAILADKSRTKVIESAIAVDQIENWLFASQAMDASSDFDGCDFLAMEAVPSSEIDIKFLKKDWDIQTIFCKFDGEIDLQSFLVVLRESNVRPESMSREVFDASVRYFTEINDEIRAKRNLVTPSKKQSLVFKGKKDDDIILVYPFTEDQNILQEAAKGLQGFIVESLDENEVPEPSPQDLIANCGNRQRAHAVTIRVQDYGRLEPLTWLNDSLVDFYMLWISRGMENVQDSDVHFFTSHFFSTLSRNGPEAVTSWTAKKKIDIFKKKLIFIPINKTMHWSLCIVVNPGEIEGYAVGTQPNQKMPCLIFLDSLKMHNPKVAKSHIQRWLNSEWKRLRGIEEEPFTTANFRFYTPQGMFII